MGDWNFVCSGEDLLTESGTELASTDYLSQKFDTLFADHLELMQHDFTYRRLALRSGGATRSLLNSMISKFRSKAVGPGRLRRATTWQW